MRRDEKSEIIKTSQLMRKLIRMMIQQELASVRGTVPRKRISKSEKYIVSSKSPHEVKRDKDKNLSSALLGS